MQAFCRFQVCGTVLIGKDFIMPKQKTRKAAAKRFKVTAGGKVKHSRMGRRHLASSKTTKRKRHLRTDAIVSPSFEKKIKDAIQA